VAHDLLVTGRDAASRRAWREAHEAYSSARADELAPRDLESFAESAWWIGRVDEAIALRERAYAAHAAAGEDLDAARVALALWFDHSGRGTLSIAQGWFAKAERHLADQPESVVHGHVAVFRGHMALAGAGSLPDALVDFDRAYDLGKRFGDRELQALALVLKGAALVHSGEVDEGLALLDESTAAALSGEVGPFATGLIYCCTIGSCQDLGDYRRAAEWTEAANRWCDDLDVNGFPGICRLHRAEIMRLRGDWPQAEEQAKTACEELQDFDRGITAGGFYEIGEIRRRRGDFAAAAEAYRKANELGRDPQPGLALLRLAEGKVEAAAAGIKRTLQDLENPLARARRLPAQVEIAIASGDLKTARAAAEELEQVIDEYRIGDRRAPAFEANLNFARGQIKLAEEDWDEAARFLRRAQLGWQEVGAPYEVAQARTLLGIAYRRQGDEDGAMAELEPALAAFERLGAMLDAERVKELLGRLETRRTFVFTDVVGSTKLLETLGEEKWKKLLSRHDALLRERIQDAGGEVIKQTGDGFFAAFATPKAAIEAGIGIQRALADEVFAPDVRVGVHTGGAFHAGGDFTDYGGQGVHAAARIGALAGGGEILVSRDTLDGIGTSFRLSEPRTEELRGFDEPIELVAVDWR
ncbi:MAG: hypothetical protein KY396_04985, partial [Actinobacteria bacterium]|nr:hypothetical protein [Actinomycetota bacterium]